MFKIPDVNTSIKTYDYTSAKTKIMNTRNYIIDDVNEIYDGEECFTDK